MSRCPGCNYLVSPTAVACPRCGTLLAAGTGGQAIPVWKPGARQQANWLRILVPSTLAVLILGAAILAYSFVKPGLSASDAAELRTARKVSFRVMLIAFDGGYPDFTNLTDNAAIFDGDTKDPEVLNAARSYDWNKALSMVRKVNIDDRYDAWLFHSHAPDSHGHYVVGFLKAEPKLVGPKELQMIEDMPVRFNTDGPPTREPDSGTSQGMPSLGF